MTQQRRRETCVKQITAELELAGIEWRQARAAAEAIAKRPLVMLMALRTLSDAQERAEASNPEATLAAWDINAHSR